MFGTDIYLAFVSMYCVFQALQPIPVELFFFLRRHRQFLLKLYLSFIIIFNFNYQKISFG